MYARHILLRQRRRKCLTLARRYASTTAQQRPRCVGNGATLATSEATVEVRWWHVIDCKGKDRASGQAVAQMSTSASSSSSSALSDSSSSGSSNNSSSSGSAPSTSPKKTAKSSKEGVIHTLMRHPTLFTHVQAPRNPIVLCHGLYGFDVRGPFLGLEIHYWAAVLDILRKKVGADVIVRGVPGTGAIAERAEALHAFLKSPEAGVQGRELNFIGHSMGGLDARHLIANIKPTEYKPVSLTSISTPHRGSPFMDWCNANVGVGNETIEQAVREARAKQQGGKADVEPEALAGNKVPYTLKTPLFVRPKKEAKEADKGEQNNSRESQSAQDDQPKTHSSVERADVDTRIEQESRGGDAEKPKEATISPHKAKEKKSKSNGLSFGLGTFASALSSLSGSFSAYMLSVFDQPAYAMLSTKYMAAVFNPSTPDVPGVKYYSIAARTRRLAVWHPLWLPKLILDAAAESRTAGGEADGSADALGGDLQGNDGLVSVQSARWGEFLGIMDGCDHWDLRGAGAPRWGSDKVNPATGKPWAGKEAEEKETSARAGREAQLAKEARGEQAAQDVKDKAEKNKQQRSSWLEINRLLDVFAKKDDKKSKQSVPQAPAAPAAIVATSTDSTSTKAKASPPSSTSGSTAAPKDAAPEVSSIQDQVADAAKGFLSHYATQASPDGSPSTSPSSAAALGNAVRDAIPSIKSSIEDNAIVTEVAAWISDRLPERDEERRAQAERAADRQDAVSKARSQALVDAQASREGDESRFTFASGPTWDQAAPSTPVEYVGDAPLWQVGESLESAPSSALSPDGSPGVAAGKRLRRDAEWLAAIEATGGSEASRQLRRELAWHRSERARLSSTGGPFVAQAHAEAGASIPGLPPGAGILGRPRGWELDWDAHAKKRPMAPSEDGKGEDERRREKERREAQSLERFWLALCLHLRNEGL